MKSSGALRKDLIWVEVMSLAQVMYGQLDLQVVVQIDKLITRIDKYIEDAQKQLDQKNKEELEPWLQKYDIWKKISQ